MYEYHHMGIPTTEIREGEKYVPKFKMYVSGYEGSEFKVQWHRYEDDCPLHPLIKTVAHVAFKVPDMQEAIKGKKVILEPYYPLEGFLVAFIEEGGAPFEFIQTDLTEEEIIERAKKNTA
jgi:hypothetical protein